MDHPSFGETPLDEVPAPTGDADDDETPAVGSAAFAAILLFENDDNIDEEPILEAVSRRLADAGALVTVDPGTREAMANRRHVGVFHRRRERVPLLLEAGIATLAITVADRPGNHAVWSGFVDREAWPEGPDVVRRERAHVAIMEVSNSRAGDGAEAAYDRALATTLAAQAVAEMVTPLAVLWHPARHALSPRQFERALRPLDRSSSPLELWTSVRPVPRPDGSEALATSGLLPLLGREIEAPSPGERPKFMARLALDLARKIIDGGERIEDGTLIEATRRAQLRVREQLSDLRPGTPAWQIHLEPQAS